MARHDTLRSVGWLLVWLADDDNHNDVDWMVTTILCDDDDGDVYLLRKNVFLICTRS